jgi:hypothetical protein
VLPKAAGQVRGRLIYPVKRQEVMSDDKKRLEEVDVTIERLVEHLLEMYQERSELRLKTSYGKSNIQV